MYPAALAALTYGSVLFGAVALLVLLVVSAVTEVKHKDDVLKDEAAAVAAGRKANEDARRCHEASAVYDREVAARIFVGRVCGLPLADPDMTDRDAKLAREAEVALEAGRAFSAAWVGRQKAGAKNDAPKS